MPKDSIFFKLDQGQKYKNMYVPQNIQKMIDTKWKNFSPCFHIF